MHVLLLGPPNALPALLLVWHGFSPSPVDVASFPPATTSTVVAMAYSKGGTMGREMYQTRDFVQR